MEKHFLMISAACNNFDSIYTRIEKMKEAKILWWIILLQLSVLTGKDKERSKLCYTFQYNHPIYGHMQFAKLTRPVSVTV